MSSIFKWFKSADCSLENGGRFGPYRLHELVNEGGMAQLWLASNTREETFALRIALPSLSSINRKRFIQGCDALSKIPSHPNLIQYFDHGKCHQTPYLAMEYASPAES